MAKIKQIKMRLEIDQSHPWKETVVNICYDSTDRRTEGYNRPIPSERFYIQLPQVVADALGYDKVRAKDQDEVMVRFKGALEQYKCMATEVNRVIVYKFDVDPKPDGKTSLWDYGYKVSISVGAFEETVMTAGDGSKRYSYEWIDSEFNIGEKYGNRSRNDGKREDRQVPWNEKNAAFFLWIKENMKLLIERLYELEQPESLIETIQAGRLLPLGSGEKGS